MKSSSDRFARAARRSTALGAAALIAGVALAPAANADNATTGTLADTLLQIIASASAAGSGEAPQDESQQAEGPRVTLSQSVISANGEHEITVTGTGFKDDSVVGARPPLAGKAPGVYVILGKFADEWKPSEDAASSARKIITQHWAVNAEDVETIGGAEDGAIVLGADGSFTATFTVSKALVEDKAGDANGNLGIYTYAGSGAKHAAWETYQPISFAEPATSPLGSLTGLFPIF
ncbi:hypothetical protein ACWIE7_05750 [Dietzia sp. NPDC055343]